jgi:hypothetical protein
LSTKFALLLFSPKCLIPPKFDPDLKKEGVDYYIECPFCKGGYMFSQEDVVFRELATGLFNE